MFGWSAWMWTFSFSPPHADDLQIERVISPTAISEEEEKPKEKPRPLSGT